MADIETDPLMEDADVKRQILALWRSAPRDGEAAAWIIKITKPASYKLIPWEKGYSTHANYKGKPPGTPVAQIHTHPMQVSPKPSTSSGDGKGKGDWDVAIAFNIPVYVVSTWEIWKILPAADKPTMVCVAKDWLK